MLGSLGELPDRWNETSPAGRSISVGLSVRRGFTLAEVVVGGGLALLLTGLTVSVWVLGSRAWNRTYRLQRAQQATLVTLSRIQQDFRRSQPGKASLQSGLLVFPVFAHQGAWDSTGNILWSGWVMYRWNGRLERREVAISPPLAQPVNRPTWPASEPGKRVAEDLSELEWSLTGSALDVRVSGRFEEATSLARLRMLPFLYQPE